MSSADTSIGLDRTYVTTLDSFFKIGEAVLALVTFICACVWGAPYGGGWVQFVGITALLLIGILFVLKLLRIIYKLPEAIPMRLVEMIIVAVYVVFFFISGIVAAVRGPYQPAAAAAAFFSFASMVVFGVDAFFKFREWREEGGSFGASSSNTTTTPNTTTVENPQPVPGQY